VLGSSKVIGTVSDIVPLIRDNLVDRVIVTTPIRQRELLEDMARSSEAEVKVEIVPDLYEIFIGRVDYTLLSDIPLIELTKDPVPGWVSLVKLLGDLLGALVLLVLLSPLMLFVAVLVKATSPGPVLFSQERVGKGRKNFNVHKFRTMVQNAEADTGPVFAGAGDARVTPLGRFMRSYRFDELPQLFNILKGEMSFVGPRPERPFFVDQFMKTIPGYGERFRVKPGLTGLAQVSGSYATTPANKLKYDLIYIYHQSIFLDLKVIFSTIRVVLTASGSR
jgi:exopolysaccharide biosynthesis polyprenyl glycosylphosphotransferase